jgi:uncharacterized protein with HEPN domain
VSLNPTSADYLEDIVREAEVALEFVAGYTAETFRADRKTVYAVVRALATIGEAAKRVLPADKDRSPSIPWRSIMGMRDRLVHRYNDIRLDVVWTTVTEDVPALLPLVRQLRDLVLAEEPPPATEAD